MTDYATLALTLHLDESVRVEVEKRFSAGFQAYRALVREALRRLDLVRESRAWRTAALIENPRERTRAYRAATDAHGLSKFALVNHATHLRNASPQLRDHLGNCEIQELATRAWRSIERHLWPDASGRKAGRPRVPREEDFRALQGNRRQGLMLKGSYAAGPHAKNQPLRLTRRLDHDPTGNDVPLYFQWNVAHGVKHRITVPVRAAFGGSQAARHAHHLSDLSKVVQVQIKRDWVRGKWKYSLAVKTELAPHRAPGRYASVRDRKVGIDLGPQRLALVSEGTVDAPGVAHLFTPSRAERSREYQAKRALRRLQRKQERSRRANNPDAYDDKRRLRKARLKKPSKAYVELRNQNRDLNRRATVDAVRRESELAKALVNLGGKHLVTEDVRVSAWAKLWGSSVRRFSPARFLGALEREAALAGGSVRRVNVWTSALSSTCVCGARRRKTLSERTHSCETCGLGVDAPIDRDLFSAFLALHLEDDQDVVDASRATSAWAGAERLLVLAASSPVSKLTGNLTHQAPTSGGSAKVVSSVKLEPVVHHEEVVAFGRGPRDGDQGATAKSPDRARDQLG